MTRLLRFLTVGLIACLAGTTLAAQIPYLRVRQKGAAGGAGGGLTSVTWTQQTKGGTWPEYNGYLEMTWDGLSQRVMHYGIVAGSSSIYSTDMFAYATGTNTWTHIAGNGSLADDCTDTWPVWPKNRHPVGQMAVDTSRNRLYMIGGVCQNIAQLDMYYLSLNGTPTLDTSWTRVTPATIPGGSPNGMIAGAMVYSPDDDVIILFGPDSGNFAHTWVYCASASLSAAQIAAGCAAASDWTEVSVSPQPQPSFPRMVYDTVNHKVWNYGASTGIGATNELWQYSIPTKTWTQKCGGACTPPPLYTGSASPPTFALVFVPSAGQLLYHQTFNTGAPRDWVYDPTSDTWTLLTTVGSGPSGVDAIAAYDATNGTIMTFSRNASSGDAEVWLGVVH